MTETSTMCRPTTGSSGFLSLNAKQQSGEAKVISRPQRALLESSRDAAWLRLRIFPLHIPAHPQGDAILRQVVSDGRSRNTFPFYLFPFHSYNVAPSVSLHPLRRVHTGMNSQDPFNLRRISGPAIAVLKSSATTLEDRACEAVERGRSVLNQVTTDTPPNMSAYAPAPQQNGWPTHRRTDSSTNQSQYDLNAHTHTNGSIKERVGGILGASTKDELPMYKDKPTSKKGYGYPSSRRKNPWFLQRRTIAIVLTSLATISWWFGILSPLSWITGGIGVGRRTLSASTWEARAKEVKEVFKISFSDYEKHAWGMYSWSYRCKS